MDNNLLQVALILRPHGIRGAFKVECLIEEGLNDIKDIFVGEECLPAKILSCSNLNKDYYMIQLDVIKTIEDAEKFRNKFIYIDRTKYSQFDGKLYLSDLIGSSLISFNGKELGKLVDYDDYGSSIILTFRCGPVSYQVPYASEIVKFNKDKKCFEIDEQVFKDVRV